MESRWSGFLLLARQGPHGTPRRLTTGQHRRDPLRLRDQLPAQERSLSHGYSLRQLPRSRCGDHTAAGPLVAPADSWETPRYLREEGDAVGPKIPRFPENRSLTGGGSLKVQDLEGLSASRGGDTSGVRFLERQKKPHEYGETSFTRQSRTAEPAEGKPHQWKQAALLPLADAVPSLKKEDIEGPPAISKTSSRFALLGAYKGTERDFFKRFFRDRDRALDGKLTRPDFKGFALRYSGPYEPPTVFTASTLGARDLKFVLMREAHRIRSGEAVDLSVWKALEARAAAICRDSRNVTARTLLRMLQAFAAVQLPLQPTHVEDFTRAIVKKQAEMRPENYVHLFQTAQLLMALVVRLSGDLCRLRFDLSVYIRCSSASSSSFLTFWTLTLCEGPCPVAVKAPNLPYRAAGDDSFAANALSKLDLAAHMSVTPLKLVLAARIPTFTAINCRAVKWGTGVELFSSAMLIDFLNCAAKQQKRHVLQRHSRDLQLMELYLRVQKPEVYEQLDLETQYFLEVIRNASTATFSDSSDDEEYTGEPDGITQSDSPSWGVWARRSIPDEVCEPTPGPAYREAMEAESFYTPAEPKPQSRLEPPAGVGGPPQDKAGEAELTKANGTETEEVCTHAVFSSALHRDISRVLNLMEVPHINSASAGPLKADCYLPHARAVIEAVSAYQLYTNTQTPTTLSRLRHELFAGMGFGVLLIHQRQWLSLSSDQEKMSLMRDLLPVEAFPQENAK
ncbi:RAP domain-containing protein [Cyclospora cayetanensis]|uniref:RAP domain-containing protein n=1 Tax=Cyclospora cayetanensis TaxID=88456 RepID=A0A1D3CW88_9EIME|nr:RAP domain-containing protein [Cyclospora cayetanensis]